MTIRGPSRAAIGPETADAPAKPTAKGRNSRPAAKAEYPNPVLENEGQEDGEDAHTAEKRDGHDEAACDRCHPEEM